MAGPLAGREEWEMIEYFSGLGRISSLAAKIGMVVASFEISRGFVPKRKPNRRHRRHPHRNSMDFCGDSGFASLSSILLACFVLFFPTDRSDLFLTHPGMSLPASTWAVRLAVVLAMQSSFGVLVTMLAPPCSTWISINIGTSKRSILVPGGDETLVQNRKANKLACRTGFVQSDLSIWGRCCYCCC